MWFLLILFFGILAFGISRIVISSKKKRKFDARMHEVGFHRAGLPQVPENGMVDVLLGRDALLVQYKGQTLSLNMNRVRAATFMTKTDLQRAGKSVIGRGVVGGVLLGPLGAIVGAASGVGDKKKAGNYLVLNYEMNGEVQVIIFDFPRPGQAKSLARELGGEVFGRNSRGGVMEI